MLSRRGAEMEEEGEQSVVHSCLLCRIPDAMRTRDRKRTRNLDKEGLLDLRILSSLGRSSSSMRCALKESMEDARVLFAFEVGADRDGLGVGLGEMDAPLEFFAGLTTFAV